MGKSSKRESQSSELLSSLGDFTSKENWDKFFTIRGADDAFEWYAEWDQIHPSLIPHLPPPSPSPQILVPGCGNSTLSENLYDAGFQGITNIDFSKVVISEMLRRNIRQRPSMRWRVMDMTSMQFMDETFDAILDKGGLDALMEPEHGPELGRQYLSEVKRVLKCGGKFICLTLAESHVLGLLFPMIRFGWKVSLHAIPQKGSSKPSLRTFMVVAEKENSAELHEIKSLFNRSSLDCDERQASGLFEALENEERVRKEYSIASEVLFTLEDLQLGAKGDLTKFSQGRRFQLTLGGKPSSRFSYRAVLLDSYPQSSPFLYHCAVFIVPQNRAHEWLFSSEEGQWQVVESSKAARLIMAFLDSRHVAASMDDLQKDLSPLVKDLAPGADDNAQIPFMMASDGIKKRSIVHQVSSSFSGPIVVEDVVYENVDDDDVRSLLASRDLVFRRLIFQRSGSLVQSEVLLAKEGSPLVGETNKKRAGSTSKSKKKGPKQNNDKLLDVYHNYLASSYHTGIISGFALVSSYLEGQASAEETVKAVIIGLGAGLLPMFLHGCMPYLKIEVVELDPVVLNIAKDYFGFVEDKNMKVHIADGIQYIKDFTNSVSDNGHCSAPAKEISKVDILIIDVDSADSSSGMACPAADFVEESFLLTVKDVLSKQGLFIINLVSRSPSVKEMVISRLKEVFSSLFSLQLEEDVNEVLFASTSEISSQEDLMKASPQFENLLSLKHKEMTDNITNASKKIRCLK